VEIIIEQQKLTNYLLVWKAKNDKSKFLNDLGYSIENWEKLRNDIKNIVLENKAIFQSSTPFGGDLYEISGKLRNFGVITIWLLAEKENSFRFVTLYPNKNHS
jgi:hypothetical protein